MELYILIVQSLITSFSSVSVHSSPCRGGPGPPLGDYATRLANASQPALLTGGDTSNVIFGQSTSRFNHKIKWPSRVPNVSWIIPAVATPMPATRASSEDVEDGLASDTSHIHDRIPNSTSMNVASVRLSGGDSALYGPTGATERHRFGRSRGRSPTEELESENEKIGLKIRVFPPRSAGTTGGLNSAGRTSLPSQHSRPRSDNYPDGRRHDSGSSLSHFSLSTFPDPPRMMEKIPQSRPLSVQMTTFRQSDSDFSSLPVPTSRMRTTHMVLGSAGTQYDVTSFIGGSSSLPIRTSRVRTAHKVLGSAGTQYDVTSFIGG